MTLLVLLVSIAMLEYVLRRPGAKDGKFHKPIDRKELTTSSEHEEASAGPNSSLVRLGAAVEQFGRGPVPQAPPRTASSPAAPKRGV